MKKTDEKSELEKLKTRIFWFCENKVNAFSPTISPAPKSVERGEIESIYEAFKFYWDRGVREFVVQKKYMGSYCDIYIHKEIEETYLISRNGHLVRNIDKDLMIKAIQPIYDKMNWHNVKCVILQSEMLPWRILGKGLIDGEFYSYYFSHLHHCDFLEKSSLYHKLSEVKKSEAFIGYYTDKQNSDIKQLSKKYPSHVIRQYNALLDFELIDIKEYRSALDVYKAQIDYFGRDEELSFKPFNILKWIYNDGAELIPNNNLSYREVNDDPFLHVAGEDWHDFEQQEIPKVYQLFNHLTSNMEEGIMIKPVQCFIRDLPPAFKVRNNDYLTMIYGVNFQQNFDYYLSKRNIKSKLECSVFDWNINADLIKVPYKSIHQENYYLKNLVLDRINGEKIEANLDIRL